MANTNLTEVFTDIADALREKTGETTTYKPTEMADAISNLKGTINASDYNCYLLVNNVDNDDAIEMPQWTAWKKLVVDEIYNPKSSTISAAGGNTAIGTSYVSTVEKLNTISSVDKIKAIFFLQANSHYIWFSGMPSTKISNTEIALEMPVLTYHTSYSKGFLYKLTTKFGLDLAKNLVYQNLTSSNLNCELMIIYED